MPHATRKYKHADVVAAIEDMYGARPLVHCHNGALSEVGGPGRRFAAPLAQFVADAPDAASLHGA